MYDLLVATRHELATRGQCKDALENPVTGGVCLLGALYRAQGWDGVDVPFVISPFDKADQAFARALGFDGAYQLCCWHRLPETTLDDALGRLDRAIEATAPESAAPEFLPA